MKRWNYGSGGALTFTAGETMVSRKSDLANGEKRIESLRGIQRRGAATRKRQYQAS